MKGTKEFYDLQKNFEKFIFSKQCHIRFNDIVRAPRDANYFYEDGKMNECFIMYMAGYSNGKCEHIN